MDRYKVLSQLGDGSYGSVWKAINRQTGEVIAVKKMKRKFSCWEECMALREVRSLQKLSHPCIVKLREVIRENDELFFIFEFMEQNLYQAIKKRYGRPFSEAQIRQWTYQILEGLHYMHQHGYFHRDMKPENLLVRGGSTIKIADFGLAREVASQPPYTEYVSTRWYRAPEVLLRKADYSAPVDLFALGAIMAELYTLKPLFPGSTEIDELCKISAVMGSFTAETWPEGIRLVREMGFRLDPMPAQSLAKIIPTASPAAIDLITSLCQWDPNKRPSAGKALQHPFFKDMPQSETPLIPAVLQERVNLTSTAVTSTSIRNQSNTSCQPSTIHSSRVSAIAMTSQPVIALGPLAAGMLHQSQPVPQAVDWTPLHTSMQISMPSAIRSQKHSDSHPAGRQVQNRTRRPTKAQYVDRSPDLWIQARSIEHTDQHTAFSKVQRGTPIRLAATHTLTLNAADRPSAKCMHSGSSSKATINLVPASRKAPVVAHFRSQKAPKSSLDRRSVDHKPRPVDSAQKAIAAGSKAPLSSCRYPTNEALMKDYWPLSASVRRSNAARALQQKSQA